MATIAESELSQLTARAGILRAGTGRAGALAKSYELRADGTGQFIWQRPVATDGDPDDTAGSYTTVRE